MGDWEFVKSLYNSEQDLVLTYDFALVKGLSDMGHVFYIDHLVDQETMQKNNFIAYNFFRKWYLDKNNQDLFVYNSIPFGFLFRLEIWNAFTLYIRSRACLEMLRAIAYEKLYVVNDCNLCCTILDAMRLSYLRIGNGDKKNGYYFPAYEWMEERLNQKEFKHYLRDFITWAHSYSFEIIDYLRFLWGTKPAIFIQDYYPTKEIISTLYAQKKLRVYLPHFSSKRSIKNFFLERPISYFSFGRVCRNESQKIFNNYLVNRSQRMILSSGADITDEIFPVIDAIVMREIPHVLRRLEAGIKFVRKCSPKLVVMVANIGQLVTAIHAVCEAKKIPSYLIINGLMSGDFLDESKYASVINSYSNFIKNDYFRGMKNVVCLGDPRMDVYARQAQKKDCKEDIPVIMIGAAAHSIVDLNSFLAVEFEFLFDILSALSRLKSSGYSFKIVIRTRSNGYISQYKSFCNEYFPNLVSEIHDTKVNLISALERADFYITTYSQTLFEASCMGVPVVYHKNDAEIMAAPFNSNCELVTTHNSEEVEAAVIDFMNGSERFNEFLKLEVIEKYIGPIDGENLARNIKFIYQLVDNPSEIINSVILANQ